MIYLGQIVEKVRTCLARSLLTFIGYGSSLPTESQRMDLTDEVSHT
jgi:hypothetical protein